MREKVNMGADAAVDDTRTADLALNRAEAALLLEALKTLRNCRKFAFRDERGAEHDPTIPVLDELSARIRAGLESK